jgi:hypothetical protein
MFAIVVEAPSPKSIATLSISKNGDNVSPKEIVIESPETDEENEH